MTSQLKTRSIQQDHQSKRQQSSTTHRPIQNPPHQDRPQLHPSSSQHPLNSPKTHAFRRLTPSKPTPCTRPVGTSSTTPTRSTRPLTSLYISKQTSHGKYVKTCQDLLVTRGIKCITLHALSAAIPHACAVLNTVLERLPFPKQWVQHTIESKNVKCWDEMKSKSGELVFNPIKSTGKPSDQEQVEMEWVPQLTDDEEQVRVRIKVSSSFIYKCFILPIFSPMGYSYRRAFKLRSG